MRTVTLSSLVISFIFHVVHLYILLFIRVYSLGEKGRFQCIMLFLAVHMVSVLGVVIVF